MRAYLAPPFLDHLVGTDGAFIGRHQFQGNTTNIIPAWQNDCLSAHGSPDFGQVHLDEPTFAAGQDFFGGKGGPFQFVEYRHGPGPRRARRHFHIGMDTVRFRCWKELEVYAAALDQADGKDQRRDREGEGQVTPADGGVNGRFEGMIAEPVESSIEFFPQRGPPATALGEGTPEMGRQDKETLEHAGGDHGDDHQGDRRDDDADNVTDDQQRYERGDGGERRARHRCRHAAHTRLGGGQGRQAGA